MYRDLAAHLRDYAAALPQKTAWLDLAGEVLQLLDAAPAPMTWESPLSPHEVTGRLAEGKIILSQWLELDETAYYRLAADLLTLLKRHQLLPGEVEPILTFLHTVHPEHWLMPSEALLTSLEDLGVPPRLVLWATQKALAPFYQRACALYRSLPEKPWERGICFCCGSQPALARLAGDTGRRWLYCGLCAGEWPFARHTCPFCLTDSHGPVSYVFHESDPARRLYQCPGCGQYLKTVDESRLSYRLYMPLEEFVTLDLDLLANPAEG